MYIDECEQEILDIKSGKRTICAEYSLISNRTGQIIEHFVTDINNNKDRVIRFLRKCIQIRKNNAFTNN